MEKKPTYTFFGLFISPFFFIASYDRTNILLIVTLDFKGDIYYVQY